MSDAEVSTTATGRCLCGAVRYQVRGPLRDVKACHCEQCRRTSGHFVAATAARIDDLVLVEEGGLAWYQSSAEARRGFCRACGSSLFWKHAAREEISIMAGALDQPTGLRTAMHIFVDQVADYHGVPEGMPTMTGAEYLARRAAGGG
jgi:hypothetical protein